MTAKAHTTRISASNLPEEYHIKDPRKYVTDFRQNILGRLRGASGLSVLDVARQTKVAEADIVRMESGKVTEADMSALYQLSSTYGVDYASILFVFKLAQRPVNNTTYKLAAYHDPKADADTQKAIFEFLSSLKESS